MMTAQPMGRTAEIIEKLVAQSKTKLPKDQAQQMETFLRQYYVRVSPDDLAEYSLLDLRGAALAHWHLARQRPPGTPKVRVYNPHFEKHGWQSTHSIVEIVTDNMPFLVDSVSMALNRGGFTIHHTIHPVVQVQRDASGKLLDVLAAGSAEEGSAEAFMHFEVGRATGQEA